MDGVQKTMKTTHEGPAICEKCGHEVEDWVLLVEMPDGAQEVYVEFNCKPCLELTYPTDFRLKQMGEGVLLNDRDIVVVST